MNNDLKELFHIQAILKQNGYHDLSRISQEILEYSQSSSTPLEDILTRITRAEPWEYIKGHCEFRGNIFKVTKDTLIPRIESEQLIDIAKEELNRFPYTSIIDAGTGSGCIVISIAKELGEKYRYYATDISSDALAIARENASRILKNNCINFINTNLIQNLELDKNKNHLVIANLPYIPTPQYLELDKSVKDFEPQIALDGGETGTKYYFELIKQIKEKGISATLILEIEPSTKDQFKDHNPTLVKDMYGRDRFLLIRLR